MSSCPAASSQQKQVLDPSALASSYVDILLYFGHTKESSGCPAARESKDQMDPRNMVSYNHNSHEHNIVGIYKCRCRLAVKNRCLTSHSLSQLIDRHQVSLKQTLKNIGFILLSKCSSMPWSERCVT